MMMSLKLLIVVGKVVVFMKLIMIMSIFNLGFGVNYLNFEAAKAKM